MPNCPEYCALGLDIKINLHYIYIYIYVYTYIHIRIHTYTNTVGYARTSVIGSRTSFVIASVRSSIH